MALTETVIEPVDIARCERQRFFRARVELDVDLLLSPSQLAGDSCAVCGRHIFAISQGAKRFKVALGHVVEPGPVTNVYYLAAHTGCAEQLEVRLVSDDGELWPW